MDTKAENEKFAENELQAESNAALSGKGNDSGDLSAEKSKQSNTADITKNEKKALRKERLSKRVWELDVLKTFAFFYMVFDHLMFNLAYVFYYEFAGNAFLSALCKFARIYRNSQTADILRILLCSGVFIFVSGVCSNFSKNNLKRGVRLGALAVLLNIGTALASVILNEDLTIRFGILALLASAMIIGHFVSKLDKTFQFGIAALILVLGIVFSNINVSDTFILPVFNFNSSYYTSADYYPLFPYASVYIFGMLAGSFLYKNKKSLLPKLDTRIFTPFKLISKYLIILYFAHQAVLYAVLFLIVFIIS